MKKTIAIAAALAALASLAVGCGKDGSSSSSAKENASVSSEAVTTEEAPEAASQAPSEAGTEPSGEASSLDIGDIAGIWYEENALDPWTLTVNEDGSYQLAYKGGGSKFGVVKSGDETGAGAGSYGFFEEDGVLWSSFSKTEEEGSVVRLRSLTDETLVFISEDSLSALPSPNEYGFYLYTDEPREGVSFATVQDIEGEWIVGQFAIKIYDCDRLSGKFDAENESGHSEGSVRLEYKLDENNGKVLWYNLYKDDGTLYKSFQADGNIPVNVLYDSNEPNLEITRIIRDEE